MGADDGGFMSGKLDRPSGGRRRWLRRLGWAVVLLTVLPIVVIAGGRWFFDDRLLRFMLQEQVNNRLRPAFEVGAVRLRLAEGITLRDVRLGPPPGFEHDILQVESIAIRWSLSALLSRRLAIHAIEVRQPRLTLEQQPDLGLNVDPVHLLHGPSAGTDADPSPDLPIPAAPADLAATLRHELPFAVAIEALRLEQGSIAIFHPQLQTHLSPLSVHGSLRAAAASHDVEIRVELGTAERPASIPLNGLAPAIADLLPRGAQLRDHMRLTWRSRDFALTVEVDDHLSLSGDLVDHNPPLVTSAVRLDSHSSLRLHCDLLAARPSVQLESFSLRLASGEQELAHAGTALSLENFLGGLDEAILTINKLEAALDLGAIDAVAAGLLPGTMQGRVTVNSPPRRLRLASLLAAPAQGGRTLLNMLGQAADPDSALLLRVAAHDLAGGWSPRRLQLSQAAATFEVRLPEAGGPAGLEWLATATAAHLQSDRLSVTRVDWRAEGFVPLAILWPAPAGGEQATAPADGPEPLRLRSITDVASLRYGPYTVFGLHSRVDATAANALAESASLSLNAQVDRLEVGSRGAGSLAGMRLAGLTHQLSVRRSGSLVDIVDHRLAIEAPALELRGGAGLTLVRSTKEGQALVVGLRRLRLDLSPTDVAAWLRAVPALLPRSAEVSGMVDASFDISSTGAPVFLSSVKGRLPPVPRMVPGVDGGQWRATVQEWVRYVDRWNTALDEGLPLRAALAVTGKGLQLEQGGRRVGGAAFAAALRLEQHQPSLEMSFTAAEIRGPVAAEGVDALLYWRVVDRRTSSSLHLGAKRLHSQRLHRAILGAAVDLRFDYLFGGDLLLENLSVSLERPQLSATVDGVVYKPLRAVVEQAWLSGELTGAAFDVGWRMALQQKEFASLGEGLPPFSGGASTTGRVQLDRGLVHLSNTVSFERLFVTTPGLRLESLSGALPVDFRLSAAQRDDTTRIDLGDAGRVGLITLEHDIRHKPRRSPYYERLLPYRQRRPLTIRKVVAGGYTMEHLEFDAYIRDGLLAAERLALNVLGAKVAGDMVLQLRQDERRRGVVGGLGRLAISHLDGSYFEALDLEPGADSELTANGSVSFVFGPRLRDVGVNMTVTHIGDNALDRLLQTLDPSASDANIQKYRSLLGWLDFHELDLWLRYEALNMDLKYSTPVKVPGLWSWRPVDEALLRRYSVVETLDAAVQPLVDRYIGKPLGW